MKTDQRGKVIDFIAKHDRFPRNAQNDVEFTELGVIEEGQEAPETTSILQVFTPAEVCLMVNRFLYQMEYQRTVHRQRERDKTEAMSPLKVKVKKLFGVSWTKATEEQIRVAGEVVRREKEEKQ